MFYAMFINSVKVDKWLLFTTPHNTANEETAFGQSPEYKWCSSRSFNSKSLRYTQNRIRQWQNLFLQIRQDSNIR